MDAYEYIRDQILPNLLSPDPDKAREAFASCERSSCEVRYHDSSPHQARFWSNSIRSPETSFWWWFVYGDELGNVGWYVTGNP